MSRILALLPFLILIGEPNSPSGHLGPTTRPAQEVVGDLLANCPWLTEQDAATRRALQKRVPEIELSDQPFEEVIDLLRKLTDLSFVPNWTALETAGIERDASITLRLRSVRVDRLIEFMLEEAGGGETQLSFEIRDGVIVLSTKEDLSRNTVHAVHECEDFLRAEETELAQHVRRVVDSLRAQGVSVGDPITMEKIVREAVRGYRKQVLRELIEVIQNTVDPESWQEAGGNVGCIASVGTKLVVTQTSSGQEAVCRVLEALRAKRRVVALQAR